MADHEWVFQGFWRLTETQLADSFEHQTQLSLGKPDIVTGPGCLNCQISWTKNADPDCPGEK